MAGSPEIEPESFDLGARVLVAVMNNPRDLDIARELRWYRIPLRRAPARIGAEYLAFYHTAAFEREKWSICYFAPIYGYHIVIRRDLLPNEPDHPRAAEEYYRVDIGPLRALPNPIPSRRLRRITFISTTVSRLFTAQEVRDLWQNGSDEQLLWHAFRGSEPDSESESYLGETRRPYNVSPPRIGHEATVLELDTRHRLIVPYWFAVYFAPCHSCDGSPSCLEMVRQAALTANPPPHSASPCARG